MRAGFGSLHSYPTFSGHSLLLPIPDTDTTDCLYNKQRVPRYCIYGHRFSAPIRANLIIFNGAVGRSVGRYLRRRYHTCDRRACRLQFAAFVSDLLLPEEKENKALEGEIHNVFSVISAAEEVPSTAAEGLTSPDQHLCEQVRTASISVQDFALLSLADTKIIRYIPVLPRAANDKISFHGSPPQLFFNEIAGFEALSRPYLLKYGAPCRPKRDRLLVPLEPKKRRKIFPRVEQP